MKTWRIVAGAVVFLGCLAPNAKAAEPSSQMPSTISPPLLQPIATVPQNYHCPPEPFESGAEMRKQGIPVSENWDYKIPCSAFLDLQTRALKGDASAAGTLVGFYLYGKEGTVDYGEVAYWMTIAAENGSTGQMAELSKLYDLSEKPEYKMRAQFWKERALK